uniref:START domain containing protein n=1 Tax=Philodina roseola TaxID=96448 RepID=B5AHB3_PHIRO|nr:START domain containing protein [Philodina roseola]
MKTNVNEINLHLLLANDVDRVRQIALDKLLKMIDVEQNENLTLAKLNKLPKTTTWKNKNVFGVPLRVYQQTTGEVLPQSICSALQYVRLHAGKCDGLFRKPGVKSKIDRLRKQIEENSTEKIQFEDFQPFVVADVMRQYFRELPEGLIPPVLTRFLCELNKEVTPDDQILAIRYIFLVLPDENREVLENLLRFLLDVSIRSGNSQTVCRSLARIFLPSVFQSFYEIRSNSTKFLWWKRKKDKADAIEQENERLALEHCLMLMMINVDLLCRVPNELNDELQLSTVKKPKNLDELIRKTCNGEFQIKKFLSIESEKFLQRLATTKFKNVPTNFDDVHLSLNKTTDFIWKCSIEIRQTNVKSVCQRLVHERFLWDDSFAESRVVEKIDDDKEIVQYVLNLLESLPVRSFCEFRFLKKISPNSVLISSTSIDHLQNHFLPGTIGLTNQMFFYVTPSSSHPDSTIVTQLVSVDFSGRSTFWYEQVFGQILAQRLSRLRETFYRRV